MVNAQKTALEKLWTDTCTVTQRIKTVDSTTKLTGWTETAIYTDIPCKLSFESYPSTAGDPVAAVTQGVKLFIDPTLSIPAGCKITVTRGSNTFHYKASGQPAIFHNHQEINLELFDKWA